MPVLQLPAKNRLDHLQTYVDDATQYATIYYCYRGAEPDDGKPVGTVIRRRVMEQGPNWRLYTTDGKQVGDGFISVKGAMMRLKGVL